MRFIIFILLISFTNLVQAQKENNIWVGGKHVGLDFNSGSPVIFPREDDNSIWRTNASICDSNGNLLFYTNGYRVFNKDLQVMQNGNNLNIGDYETWGYDLLAILDGAAIVPVPGQADKYYVFHVDNNLIGFDTFATALLSTNLFYCLIDMSLDNGNGGIVNSQKDIVLLNDTLVNEGVKIVKHGNGRDYWLICHEASSNRFYRFLIDPFGIHGPYEQEIGDIIGGEDAQGFTNLAFSKDGTKAAQCMLYMTVNLYDFNRCTGEFYNLQTLMVNDSLYYTSDAEFSPSGKYLYVCTNSFNYIFQFDVTAADIYSSRQLVAIYSGATNPFNTDFDRLGLGPDDKIYVSTYDGNRSLHIIHQPDSSGTACQFEENGLQVYPPGINWHTIPNTVNYSLGALVGSGCDTLTSISPPSKTFINIYPNPVTDILYYQSSEPVTKISLYDVCGREIKLQANNQTIDVGRFTPGVYLIELITPHQTFRQRIVKLSDKSY